METYIFQKPQGCTFMYSMQIEGELYEDIMKKEIYYLKNTRLVTIVTTFA